VPVEVLYEAFSQHLQYLDQRACGDFHTTAVLGVGGKIYTGSCPDDSELEYQKVQFAIQIESGRSPLASFARVGGGVTD
jgi:hypothetical protein